MANDLWVPNQRNSRDDISKWVWYRTDYSAVDAGPSSHLTYQLTSESGSGAGAFVAPNVILTVRHNFNGIFDGKLKQSSEVEVSNLGISAVPQQPGFGKPGAGVGTTDIGIVTTQSDQVASSALLPMLVFDRGATPNAAILTKLGFSSAFTIGYPQLYNANGVLQPDQQYKLTLTGFKASGSDQWQAPGVIGGEGNSGGPLVLDTSKGQYIGGVFAWANATGRTGQAAPTGAADFPGGGKIGDPAKAAGVGGTLITKKVEHAIAAAYNQIHPGQPNSSTRKQGALDFPTDLLVASDSGDDDVVVSWGRNVEIVNAKESDKLWVEKSIFTGNPDDSDTIIRLAGGIGGAHIISDSIASYGFPTSIRHPSGVDFSEDGFPIYSFWESRPDNAIWKAEYSAGETDTWHDSSDHYSMNASVNYALDERSHTLTIDISRTDPANNSRRAYPKYWLTITIPEISALN